MSKIKSVNIDWMERFANFPRIVVTLTEPLPSCDDLIFENRDDCYLNVSGDIGCFYFYSQPSSGFGGRHFKLKMSDGTEKVLIGPWSGCTSEANELFPEYGLVEVSIKDSQYGNIAGAALYKSLVPFLKEQGIRCGLVDVGFGKYFQPLYDNGKAKSDYPVIQEF